MILLEQTEQITTYITEQQGNDIISLLQSININIQYIGYFVILGLIIYAVVKLLWAFVEPMALD